MDRKFRDFLCLSPAAFALTCAVAAFLGWTAVEPFFREGGSAANAGVANAFFCSTVTGLIAAALVFTECCGRRNRAEAVLLVVSGFGVVFVACFLLMIPSQVVFSRFWTASHAARGFVQEPDLGSVVMGRAVSWALFSIGTVAVVLVNRGLKVSIVALASSVLSGAVSGLLFDPIQMFLSGHGPGMPWVSRMICFSIFGGLTGLLFGMIRTVSRSGLLLITAGEFAGKRLVLDSEPCLIGSSPKCDLRIFEKGQNGLTAVIRRVGFGFRFYALDRSSACSLNNRQIRCEKLRTGDRLRICGVDLVFSYGD